MTAPFSHCKSVAYYGLDPLKFISTHLPAPDNRIHINPVGRLEVKKGYEYLIDACKLLTGKLINDHYLGDQLRKQSRLDGLSGLDIHRIVGSNGDNFLRTFKNRRGVSSND